MARAQRYVRSGRSGSAHRVLWNAASRTSGKIVLDDVAAREVQQGGCPAPSSSIRMKETLRLRAAGRWPPRLTCTWCHHRDWLYRQKLVIMRHPPLHRPVPALQAFGDGMATLFGVKPASYFFSILDTQVATALHACEVTPRVGVTGCQRASTSARCPS